MFNKDADCTLTDEEIDQQARSQLAQMTLKEKVRMLNGNWDPIGNFIHHRSIINPIPVKTNGVKRLNISPIAFTDGPRGIVVGHATCFPVAMARGASFDRALEERIGDVMGKESRAQGANICAGVCINLLRHPAWGRAQETYGEDTYLLGEMSKSLITGMQKHNVMACVKHFALNSIENSRFSVNVEADDRTMHEVFLPHFKKAVEAGAASFMGAYNRYNGVQACEHQKLLTDILRTDWGFKGFTLSDFVFGIRDTKRAIEAGMDVEMPMPIYYNHQLLDAVKTGKIDESVIDNTVLRVLRTLLAFENCPDPVAYTSDLVAHPDHISLAREAAEKSAVLIKNEENILPFNMTHIRRILVLGQLAAQGNTGDRGSSQVPAPFVTTPLSGLKSYFDNTVEIIHRENSSFTTQRRIDEVKALAADVDCVIIVAGNDHNDEGEYFDPSRNDEMADLMSTGYKNQGMLLKSVLTKIIMALMKHSGFNKHADIATGGDRRSLSLKERDIAMIEAVSGINPNTVVTLIGGSMQMIDDWSKNIPAILYGWYSGMEGGHALARILFGAVNPSGRLPFTIPTDTAHLPYFSSTDETITYDRYHGYSLLDKNGHRPRYPFGFGLSYTTFVYSDLSAKIKDKDIEISVTVANTGRRDGAEVIQVYVGMVDSQIERQKKQLKGFEKKEIKSGESKRVSIHVSIDELRYYDPHQKRWILEPGTYRILVGPHSGEDALLETQINLFSPQ